MIKDFESGVGVSAKLTRWCVFGDSAWAGGRAGGWDNLRPPQQHGRLDGVGGSPPCFIAPLVLEA